MAHGYLGRARRLATRRGEEHKQHSQGHAQERASTDRWDKIRGEGNYKAAREFDEAERRFVESGKLDEAVRDVPPKSEAEKQEMEDAEKRARERAKEEDPALLKKPQAKRQGKR